MLLLSLIKGAKPQAPPVLLFSWLFLVASVPIPVEEFIETVIQNKTQPDIWTEGSSLRHMVVELQVELRNMTARLKQAEIQAGEQELGLLQTKTRLEELRQDHADMEKRLNASQMQGEELRQENAELATEVTALSVRLEASERQVEGLKVELGNNTVELSTTQARVTVNRNDLQLLQRRLDDSLTRNTDKESKTYVFSAELY